MMNTKLFHKIGPFLGLFLFAVALAVLYHELKVYHLHDIVTQIEAIPADSLFLAAILTFLSYLVMNGYDTLALWYVRHPLSYGKIAIASFIGYAFSNNVGLAMLAGGSVRYRLYSSWGLSVLTITKIVAFCTLSLWLGFFLLGGIVFLIEPMTIPEALHLPFVSARPIGWLFIALVAGYLGLSVLRKKPLRIRNWEFSLPSAGLLVSQTAISLMDWLLAGAVLYVLLPPSPQLSWSGFLGVFLLAQLAGLASQLPGGLGVFETVVILLLSSALPASHIIGPLLAYRGIYYLLPLLIAALLLASQEVFQKIEGIKKVAQMFGAWMSAVVPPVFAFCTFVGGAVLLFSGATPTAYPRLTWLKDVIPLPVVELSHFLGSLCGIMLLLLARGIQRRIDASYVLTIFVLGAGIIFSLLKGFDYEEASVLLFMLVALLPCRRYFYRKGSLINERFSPGWIAAILLVLLCSIWLGFFSYKHVEYSHDLWWQFTFRGDAPRFMRATVGVGAVIAFWVFGRLLRPSKPDVLPVDSMDLDRAIPIVRSSPQTYANLALLGDKCFLFNEQRNTFIMYRVSGRSWVAMGDPIGPRDEWPELIWRFREMCDQYDGWTVFYEVGRESLHVYLDTGLTLAKLGEEGRVSLESFSLEGSLHRDLRHTCSKLERDGYRFQMVSVEKVPALLPEFRKISDSWLEEKHTREKGFSLGFFDEAYLRRFPAGIIQKDDQVIGFANVWIGADKKELSIDLMRYRPEAPNGLMDYLFTQLMLWAKQDGFQGFDLGMAPLSGLEDHDLAPLWSRAGAFVFRHAEHFYNLQGLRRYKEKFAPLWEPKYLASPGGLSLPRVLTNVASLTSGGIKGVVTR